MSEQNAKGRSLRGVVVSNKMDKTIVVLVTSTIKHPLYGKVVKRRKKLHVHDPENQCKEGETVVVRESRPISKTKNWLLVERIEKTKV
jgi:small subunit ribosomal protein S17